MAGTEVIQAFAAVLRTGLGVGISALCRVRQMASLEEVKEVLRRFHRAGKRNPQQGESEETGSRVLHNGHYTEVDISSKRLKTEVLVAEVAGG